VKPGDNLFEIETDKVSMEVPSTTTGVLSEIRVVAGEIAPVGAIVAVIADGTKAQASLPAAAQTQAIKIPVAAPPPAATLPSVQPRQQSDPIKLDPFFEVRTPEHNFGPARLPGGTTVTPLARRLAAEGGIDL
jgi:pyruvate dehydrogenase E2 component (dihydrolipoamide acetyltransferase)